MEYGKKDCALFVINKPRGIHIGQKSEMFTNKQEILPVDLLVSSCFTFLVDFHGIEIHDDVKFLVSERDRVEE